MFENIRDKIYNVQADISSSLSILTIGSAEKKAEKNRQLKFVNKIQNSNPEAGFNFLAWNQKVWKEMHSQCEQNCNFAEKIGNKLNFIESLSYRSCASAQEFINQMEDMKTIENQIECVIDEIKISQKYINHLEALLLQMEKEKEEKILAQFESDLNNQLITFKERKNSELKTFQVKLFSQHFKKLQEFEKKEKIKLKAKQEAFQAAFEKEVNQYKLFGKLETKNDLQNLVMKPIEEIEIEPNEEEKVALNEFLAEDS